MKHEMRVKKSRKQSKTADNSKIGQDLFTYLPSEIILDILSRLPARTIMSCKCVCKPWLNLLVTPEFVKSHLSKSVPGLAVLELKTQSKDSKPYRIVEFVEEVDLNCDELHLNVVCNFDLPFRGLLRSSANGLLFLHNIGGYYARDIVLCNLITRDYIKIPCPGSKSWKETYGFGVSRMSCQYKVVRIVIERQTQTPLGIDLHEFNCQVYTVGTGSSWRGIASSDPIRMAINMAGAFLNGNLHWAACKSSTRQISCLDLESEVFSSFSAHPLSRHVIINEDSRSLSVLRNCLCVCDNSKYELMPACEVDIWLMKEYGDEKSWSKQFSIHNVNMGNYCGYLSLPFKVFKDGDILMELGCKLVYYSSKTKSIQEADHDMFGLERSRTTIFTPSFLSLKTFAIENVSSF